MVILNLRQTNCCQFFLLLRQKIFLDEHLVLFHESGSQVHHYILYFFKFSLIQVLSTEIKFLFLIRTCPYLISQSASEQQKVRNAKFFFLVFPFVFFFLMFNCLLLARSQQNFIKSLWVSCTSDVSPLHVSKATSIIYCSTLVFMSGY